MSVVERGPSETVEDSLSWQDQDFSSWSKYGSADIQNISDEEISDFDRAITEGMKTAGYDKARTLEELRAKMLADSGRTRFSKKATPADYRTYIQNQLKEFERFQQRLAAAEQAQQDQESANAESQLKNRATILSNQAYQAWNSDREPRDATGRRIGFESRDEGLVDSIDERTHTRKLEEEVERSSRLEVGFFHWLKEAQVFGSQAEIASYPSSRYDDVARGVDGVVMITIPDEEQGSRHIPLGIDFTTNMSEVQLAWKLSKLQSEPVANLKYGTKGLPPNQRFIRSVISIDRERMQRMSDHLFLAQAAREQSDQPTIVAKGESLLNQHRDREVFMSQVVDELREQVAWGREVLQQHGSDPAEYGDHEALLKYLDELGAERKDLHARGREEVEREGGSAMYRTQDAQFIRRATEVLAGAAGGRESSAVA